MNKKANIDDIVEKGLILFGFAFSSVLGIVFLTKFNTEIQGMTNVSDSIKSTILTYVTNAPVALDYAFVSLLIIITIFSVVMASIIQSDIKFIVFAIITLIIIWIGALGLSYIWYNFITTDTLLQNAINLMPRTKWIMPRLLYVALIDTLLIGIPLYSKFKN